MTTFGDIRFMRIFVGVPWGGGVKRQWGCRQCQFSAFSLVISSHTLEVRLALLRATAYAVSAHMLSQFRPSVCLSVRHTGGSVKNGLS